MRAFVIGNGISRKGIDIPTLKEHGAIYGCNALYREFAPDVLVATDSPIASAIQESGYALKHRFYTRKPIGGKGAQKLPPETHGFSSGPNAVALAVLDNHKEIYLVGFDMGPKEGNQFNNIYADTEFYKTSKHPPTFSGNWIKQMVQIMQKAPRTQFYRVCGPTTARIANLETVNNLQHLDLAIFLDRINNKKDL